MTAETVAGFLSRLSGEAVYDAVIVDIGQFGRLAADILDGCDTVYMPVKEDVISAAKIEIFEEYLEASGRQKLQKRIQKIKLPYHSNFSRREDYLEQLIWGELGDYVRRLLREKRNG